MAHMLSKEQAFPETPDVRQTKLCGDTGDGGLARPPRGQEALWCPSEAARCLRVADSGAQGGGGLSPVGTQATFHRTQQEEGVLLFRAQP